MGLWMDVSERVFDHLVGVSEQCTVVAPLQQARPPLKDLSHFSQVFSEP
jgi:hypothetical protein